MTNRSNLEYTFKTSWVYRMLWLLTFDENDTSAIGLINIIFFLYTV